MTIKIPQNPDGLHRQFVQLGRERNLITYKLLTLLPEIYRTKIYETKGYTTIYEYAAKLAGLSQSVVEKALKLKDKLKDKPNLQKAIETQGIHKVSIVAQIATPETDSFFADKVENMSKPALQQLSRELRGKIQTSWQIEMDNEMMTMFLKIKKSIGKNLSNKEAMRGILKTMANGTMGKTKKSQPKAKKMREIPGEQAQNKRSKITRYIPAATRRLALSETNGKCSHQDCHHPAEVIHHQVPFSQSRSHSSIAPLCKIHHEFAHNGITGQLTKTDLLYRHYRQKIIDKRPIYRFR